MTREMAICITIWSLLWVGLISGVNAAEETGRVLSEGPIHIQLNTEPAVSIASAAKIGYGRFKEDIQGPEDTLVYTKEQLDFIAANSVRTRKIPDEIVPELKRRNANLRTIIYIASTYLKDDPLDETESVHIQHLAMCPAAVLDKSIDASTAQVVVSPYTLPQNKNTEPYYETLQYDLETMRERDERVIGANWLIPILAGTTSERHSKNSREFVFFIRVGDEIMRVEKWTPETGEAKVLRGWAGTTAVSHARGAVVTSPIYCGTARPTPLSALRIGKKWEKALAEVNRLTYCMNKAPESEPIFGLKAELVLAMMKERGYDGVEMDVMTANLPMFNMVNAHGLKTVPWHFGKNRPFTVDEWIEGHDRVCGYIQRYVHDRLGRWPALIGNGLNYSNFEKGDGDGGYCKRLLIPTDLKPKGLWGYNSEKGLAVTGTMFPGQLRMLQIACREHLAVAAEMKAASVALSQSQYDEMMHYSAAFLYIAWTPAKEGCDIDRDGPGMTVPVTFLSPYFRLPAVGPTWRHPYNGKDYKIGLPYTLFLPLGHPLDDPEPGDLESLRYRDTNVFIRRYENGLILLNPTGPTGTFKDVDAAVDGDLVKEGDGEHSLDLDLPRAYTVELDQRYIAPETCDYVEGAIEMPAATGKILLKKASLHERN